eukprot:437418_1
MYSNLHKCWKVTHVIIGPPNAGKTLFFEYCTKAPLDEEKGNHTKRIATQTSKFSHGYHNNPSQRRTQATIGMDLSVRHVTVDDQPVTLNIWDTAGQDKYETITNSYFRKADIIWILLDLTDEQGIDSLNKYWLPRAFEYATKPHMQAILIGNKYDIIEEVLSNPHRDIHALKRKYEELVVPKIQQLISTYNLPYFAISAKTGYNVMDAFMTVNTAFMRNIIENTNSKSNRNMHASSRGHNITLDSNSIDIARIQSQQIKSGCCT